MNAKCSTFSASASCIIPTSPESCCRTIGSDIRCARMCRSREPGIRSIESMTDGGITTDLEVEQDYERHSDEKSGTRSMVLNMGPQHPSTHGVLRLLLELDGETILKAAPDIGYLHTGIEKEFEAKTYQQGVTLTDRIDYLAPLSNNLVYCLAAEKLLGLEIPAHAQWTRVMLAELTRLNSHLVWLGTHAIDIGAMSVFLYCFRERE